jgi:hypothetical protein
MEFYNIDSIGQKEGKVRVRFNHDVNFVGFYCSQSDKSIPKNAPVDVPLFLVDFLLENEHCTLSKEILSDTERNDLLAKASSVNLRSINPHFFMFYKSVPPLKDDSSFLYDVFTERMRDFSLLMYKEALSEDDLVGMDVSERKLIVKSRKKYTQYRKLW